MKIHIVQKGDTLWKIAKKYGVNFEELKKMNSQLSNPDMIMPGMKIKVPTTGGTIKKEGPVNMGGKKEFPIAEQPFTKEVPIKEVPIKEVPIKEAPIKEVPIKEQPIIKETPKAPYTPKMPLQVVPEIDINNYYMTNMMNMTVKPELPPKPANILPEVKEVPKKEMPKIELPKKEMPLPVPPPPPPVQEAPCPPQEYCVPVTPIMPGPGFCPPYGGMPVAVQPCMPFPQMQAEMPAVSNAVPNMMPNMTPNAAPMAGETNIMPQHFTDESSSFMPQMPAMDPGFHSGGAGIAGMENPYPMAQAPGYPQAMGMDPGGYGMQPAYQQAPGAYGGMPMMHSQTPVDYGQMPAGFSGGYGQMPGGYPEGFGQFPAAGGYPAGMEYGAAAGPYGTGGYPAYGPTPYGYPQMMGPAPLGMGPEFEYGSPDRLGPATDTLEPHPPQGLPVGTGALGDCGCSEPTSALAQTNFVPPTPPIYSAPYTGPVDVAQPPFMNPYGMGPVDTSSYGMPGHQDESS